MTDWAARLRDGIRQLRERDPSLEVFGVHEHGYRIGEPLPEAELAAIEQRHGVTVPEDYRHYLMHVGNGGAGPGYGLSRFAWVSEQEVLPAPRGELGAAFYDAAIAEALVPGEARKACKIKVPVLPDEYFGDDATCAQNEAAALGNAIDQGTYSLADYGCAINAVLVLRGPRAGTVWIDDRANSGAVADFATWTRTMGEGRPAAGSSFSEWMLYWLEDALAESESVDRGAGPDWTPPTQDPRQAFAEARAQREAHLRKLTDRAAAQGARDARRTQERPGLERRSAPLIAIAGTFKDGATVAGSCPKCQADTELRMCLDSLVLCRKCYFAW